MAENKTFIKKKTKKNAGTQVYQGPKIKNEFMYNKNDKKDTKKDKQTTVYKSRKKSDDKNIDNKIKKDEKKEEEKQILDNKININEHKIKKEIEEFFCSDKQEFIDDIIKNKKHNSLNNDDEEEFRLIMINKDNNCLNTTYKKRDFILDYKFIYIHNGEKTFKFLVQRNKFNKPENEEEIILEELKKSNFLKKFEKHFNIKDKTYNLSRHNNEDGKFVLKILVNLDNNRNSINNNQHIDDNNNNGQNQINLNNNNNNNTYVIKEIYFFPLVGLNNVGSTCFMNATLQCLIHVPELSLYFLNEYPIDKQALNSKNAYIRTRGNLSQAYYDVIKGVSKSCSSYRPATFKQILGKYNLQFSSYEANDSKDLILYLLQTFHEELNYFGDKTAPINRFYPNPINRQLTYNSFNYTYNSTNFSKISVLFYGTYENVILCSKCNNNFYSYQKFEYISFSTYKYRNKTFDIMDGFRDIEAVQPLKGNNQYYCNICKKLVNAEITCKIIDLPKYLILNIDYGKNKINDVYRLNFDFEIDLKDYISFYFGQKTKYRLMAICTHIGSSGPTGHYVAYCYNKKEDTWYNFNDSSCRPCSKNGLNYNSPYLLIYEMI